MAEVDPGDLELLAEALYREAGFDPETPAHPVRIARALLRDAAAVELVPRHALRGRRAMLARVEGNWRIFLRRDVPRAELGWLCGHELAHWAMRREGVRFEAEADEERACDHLGAALVVPRRAFAGALRAHGTEPAALAEALDCSQTLAALRFGETTGHDLAVVRPGLIRIRGQLSFVWPREEEIVRWARGAAPAGVVKTRLTDDPRRVVLLADDVEPFAESG